MEQLDNNEYLEAIRQAAKIVGESFDYVVDAIEKATRELKEIDWDEILRQMEGGGTGKCFGR